jgi:hypothetical protein
MEQEFRRALESTPNDAIGHTWFGWVVCRTGSSKKGLAEIRRGLELDPLSPSPNFYLGPHSSSHGSMTKRYGSSAKPWKSFPITPMSINRWG